MDPKTVLVVDDEASILAIFEKALTRSGYQVHTADNAEEALSMFASGHYWIVLADLKLPQMDGLELCRRMKQEFPFSVLFAMTGFVSVYDLTACREAGFEDLFIKPVNLELVLAEIDHAATKITRWRSGQ
jgi:CheY-like chemotaxis protein